MKNHGKNLLVYSLIFAFIALTMAAILTINPSTEEKKFNYGQLIQSINEDKVESITLQKESKASNAGKAIVVLKGEKEKKIVEVVNMDSLNDSITQAKLTNPELEFVISPVAEPSVLASLIVPIILFIVTIVAFFFIMQQMQGGGGNRVMSFGKSKAKLSIDDKKKVTFENVAGLDEEKAELAEIVEFLKLPKKFIEIGARIPKGVLLVGPPGTGKTLLARAVSGEAGVPFFSISGSDFVEMFVGVGASRVRDLFEQAKKNSPCIIFIDEIDAVGRKRGAGLGGGHDEREQTLNQLLVEMDGFGANEGIIVLAATNRADILDPALLRPGRFDRRVVVGLPDAKGREEILNVHAKGKIFDSNIDLKAVAKTTAGFTGADLENLLNESAILAARDNKKSIDTDSISRAFIKVGVGTEKKSRIIPEKDRLMTAYHETGHAILHEALSELDPVHLISIIPTGWAGGFTMHIPQDDMSYNSKIKMEQEITSLLGGRAAEELILNDVTTGASNDIQRASKIARSMVTKYGMSKLLGPIQFGDDNEEVFIGRDLAHSRNYSDDIATQIDSEVKRIIETCYDEAISILTEKTELLHKTAKVLMKREKITGDEFRILFSGGDLVIEEAAKTEFEEKIQDTVEKITGNEKSKI